MLDHKERYSQYLRPDCSHENPPFVLRRIEAWLFLELAGPINDLNYEPE